jgi:hypothetical protein
LFGEAKDWHGLRRFRLRRLEKVNAEALLVAAGQNVKRLLTFGRKGPRRPAQVVALHFTPTARRPLRRIPSRRQFPLARPFFNSLSTLAIWPGSNPPRLGALLKPLGLYTGRLGRSTRKKSPYKKNLQLCWKARF